MNGKLLGLTITLVAVAFLALASVFTVNERQLALVVQFGNPKRIITEPGLQWKLPFIEQVTYLDKRIRSLDVRPQEVLASDQKRIVVDSFARYRIVHPLETFKAARDERGAERLLDKIMESTVRQVLANEEMPTIVSGERGALMKKISEITNVQAASIGIEVVDVRLKRVDLPPQNSQAIFDRMETERKREAAEIRAKGEEQVLIITANADREVATLTAEANKTAQIMSGEADAKAVKIFAHAYNQDVEFFEFYRTMQAYKKALGKDDTQLVLSPDSEFFKMLMSGGNRK